MNVLVEFYRRINDYSSSIIWYIYKYKYAEIAIALFSSFLFILLYTLSKAQDVNSDQLNYHIYSVYALLHGRHYIDIMPSQMQTWTNPLGSVLQYFLIMTLPPRTVSLLMGALAAVSVPIVYALAKATLNQGPGGPKGFGIVVSALAAAGALSSPIFLSEVGTTFNDYWGAIIILAALWLVVRRPAGSRAYIFAGALLGVAVGVKLTNVVFVLGWVAAIVALETTRAVRPLLLSGVGCVAAYLPVGGLWNAYIYSLLKNPIFPLYNHVFKSDAYAHVPMLDARFKPTSFTAALEYLPKLASGVPTTTEIAFRDIRFLLVALLLTLALPRVVEWAVRGDGSDVAIFDRKRSFFVLVFAVVSFVAWLTIFGIERYALLLEQLAPLVFLILLARLCANRRVFTQAAVMGLLLIVATSTPADWGRAALSNDWFAIATPAPLREGGIMYIMLSDDADSYVIPYLPASDSFIRIEGNMPLDPAVGLGKAAKAAISAHAGEIRTLAPAKHSLDQSRQRLAGFGLAIRSEDCLFIDTKVERLKSCPLSRL